MAVETSGYYAAYKIYCLDCFVKSGKSPDQIVTVYKYDDAKGGGRDTCDECGKSVWITSRHERGG